MRTLRASLPVWIVVCLCASVVWFSNSSPAGAVNANAEEFSVETSPPVVVKTVPEAGSIDVDSKLAEIKVTFSKEMQDRSWSWSRASLNSFPKTTGDPAYDKEKRTCVLPVKLEPGKTYGFWLNSSKFKNFKDSERRPAVPYLLVFKTKAAE